MSAERATDEFACRDYLEPSRRWVHDRMECAGCGIAVIVVRPLGIGIADDVKCSDCRYPVVIH